MRDVCVASNTVQQTPPLSSLTRRNYLPIARRLRLCPVDPHQETCESATPAPSTISASSHASATTTGRSHPSVSETRSFNRRKLELIPRRFHQIALQIRFCRWPDINVVRFCGPGFLPTRFRRLIKRQLREFPQQSRMRRHHLLFPRLIQIPPHAEPASSEAQCPVLLAPLRRRER